MYLSGGFGPGVSSARSFCIVGSVAGLVKSGKTLQNLWGKTLHDLVIAVFQPHHGKDQMLQKNLHHL
jgi:hypothetical protein